jgi:hypothetical protein
MRANSEDMEAKEYKRQEWTSAMKDSKVHEGAKG